MIYFNLNIRRPSWWRRFSNIKNWVGATPFKHKYWEIQIIKNDNLVRIEFEWTVQQDHAGVNLELGLFGYEIHATIYDSRHWNTDKNQWMSYHESGEY